MAVDDFRRLLKRSPLLVRLKRALWAPVDQTLNGCDIRIIKEFPVFAPHSSGSRSALAQLTARSASETFPLIVQLMSTIGRYRRAEPVGIDTLCNDESSRALALRLKLLFDKYGSDKGTNGYHHVYSMILAGRTPVEAILEFGLGTNNEDVVSNMGRSGRPGASLRAFREFAPKARIYGADVDMRILFEDTNIRTFYVDQTDPASFEALAGNIDEKLDLIIDDGLHSPNANIATLIFGLHNLKPRGCIVVEDIAPAALPVWHVISALLPTQYKSCLVDAKGAFLFVVELRDDSRRM
jgi:hypothetical protein